MATIWQNNGGIDDDICVPSGQEIISVDLNKQADLSVYEVFISLKSMPQDRLMLDVTARQTFRDLFERIRDSL